MTDRQEVDDGGHAFPAPPCGDSMTFEDGRTTHQFSGSTGMTLRDYFAAHAPPAPTQLRNASHLDLEMLAGIRWRWQYADAMLKARQAARVTELPELIAAVEYAISEDCLREDVTRKLASALRIAREGRINGD